MAEEYKNTVHEHETTPKVTTEESSTAPPEVQSRGMFDFLKKKEEVKPQETKTTQISEHEPHVAKHKEEEHHEHNKPTLLEKLHQKHEDEEQNKPNLLEKLHRSNSSSSSSDEEGGKIKKKDKKRTDMTTAEENQGVMDKIKDKFPHGGNKPEGHDVATTMPAPHSVDHHKQEEHEKKGVMDMAKEKLPGHSKKPEESHVVNTKPLVDTATPISEHPEEKKGFMGKIKEHLPGHHAKTEEKTDTHKYSG